MIFILTGAGISKESGIETFRDSDGLWASYSIEEVATFGAFKRDPTKVYKFYDERRKQLLSVLPNAAHLALAELEKSGQEIFLVTQNVDDLHEKAGSQNIIHMHGRLNAALCLACRHNFDWAVDLSEKDRCPNCGGTLRPDVVWFGEQPYHMPDIFRAIKNCKLFVSIGTSGAVYPAAGLVTRAKQNGAKTIELNLEPSLNANCFDQGFYGPATEVVPHWVGTLLIK
ncbi:MAG: NAD-dependent deacylase [Deltaproteobacteria bacterium]|jgi:NAD-dependent deacetylase|nr:NAD-dependent deacylase [Deltaproteobacteria bacterium]